MSHFSIRIVYADDDDLVRGTVSALLRCSGLDVHDCRDGSEAMDLCRALHPVAALLDLNMPDCDGFTAARRLRADPDTHDIRLVALTGLAVDSNIERAIACGFDVVLTKPTSVERIVEALTAQCSD